MTSTDRQPGTDTGRRTFLRRATLAGFCACASSGAEAVVAPAGATGTAGAGAGHQAASQPEPMAKKWVATLLPLLAVGGRDQARQAIRACWPAHFESLGIQPTLDKFHGNLDGFLRHLQAEWGWVVSYSPDQGVILVDENKPACVCPVVPKNHAGDLGLICFCSEGIAERMFSDVVGHPVRAQVVASILRGDRSCKYRIDVKGA
jgi:hypothetical protein